MPDLARAEQGGKAARPQAPVPAVPVNPAETPASTAEALRGLRHWFQQSGPVAVATSGGVDSVVVAFVAHEVLGRSAEVFHAVSAAVQASATRTVRGLAEAHGWNLTEITPGEFEDANYVSNPVNRCYFCKSHLYAEISRHTHHPIVSGTNLDDLGDFRPGLRAAAESSVRHPLVEVGIAKPMVRAVCAALGMPVIAVQPAQPCLASRVRTGIAVTTRALAFVEAAEQAVARHVGDVDLRCRLNPSDVVVEIENATLSALTSQQGCDILADVNAIASNWGMPRASRMRAYRVGSAFIGRAGQ